MSKEVKVKTLSQFIGNIKREYSKEDFNPYSVMLNIYDNMLHVEGGSRVAVVGYGERFEEHIVKAWWHVLSSKGLIEGNRPPLPIDGHFVTHTGVIIQFVGLKDELQSQVRIQELIDQCRSIALCSKYVEPSIRSAIRASAQIVDIYDFSENNVEEVVDKEEE